MFPTKSIKKYYGWRASEILITQTKIGESMQKNNAGSIGLALVAWALSINMGHAVTTAQIDEARAKGLAWLYVNQKGDGSWSTQSALSLHSTANVLEALRTAGVKSGHGYSAGAAWLSNTEPLSTDALSRKIIILNQAGLDTAAMVQSLMVRRLLNERQVWGTYAQHDMTLPDTALGLAAIRQTGYTYADANNHLYWTVYCEILPAQKADGGWSYAKVPGLATSGGESAVISTALILPELKAIQTAKGWDSNAPCGTSYSLNSAINNAVTYLNSQRHADNGIGIKGVSTPLETALAYVGIQSVTSAHAALIPALDYLLIGGGKPLSDGSWAGDPFTTAQVLKLLPAVTLADTDKDGIPDVVELVLNKGTSPNYADGRKLGAGNGQSQPGVDAALFITTAYLNVPLSYNLQGGGTFNRVSGQLPPGLSLSGTGLLSGTPIQLGDYSFVYANTSGQTVATVTVLKAGLSGDINSDGVIDIADVALLQRHVLGLASLPADQAVLADLAPAGLPDGVLDVADVQRLIRKALGLE